MLMFWAEVSLNLSVTGLHCHPNNIFKFLRQQTHFSHMPCLVSAAGSSVSYVQLLELLYQQQDLLLDMLAMLGA